MESQQRAWIADIERPSDHQIEEAEDCYVGADTDGEHQYRHEREAGRLSQHSRRVANILAEAVDPCPAPSLARFLAEAQRVAEVPLAFASGHFTMKYHVVSQFPIEAATAQKIPETAEGFVHWRSLSGCAQDGLNGLVHAVVAGQFGFEPRAATWREPIETDFAIRLGDAPLGGRPALEQYLLKGGIERSFLHLQHFGREDVNPLGDRVPMESARAKDSQDQQRQGARWHLLFRHRHYRGIIAMPDRGCQEQG